ncbi:MAG: DUF642 domain-containing protein [Pseudomonadota bacterium]
MNHLAKFATCALLAIAPLAHAKCDCNNLLINGSFEESLFLPSTWATIPGNDNTSIVGWETVGSGVEWYKDTDDTGKNPDGDYAIDLNNYRSEDGGGIQQSFATSAGARYLVQFYASTQKSAGRLGTAKLSVSIGDESYVFNLKTDESKSDWTYFSFSFKATDTLSTLKLTTNTDSLKSFTNIDNVSVTHICGPKAVLIDL